MEVLIDLISIYGYRLVTQSFIFLKLFLVDDHDDDDLYLSANEIRISAFCTLTETSQMRLRFCQLGEGAGGDGTRLVCMSSMGESQLDAHAGDFKPFGC